MDGYYSLEGWLAPSMVHVCIMLDVYFHNTCSILIYHKCDNHFFLQLLLHVNIAYMSENS